MLDSGDPKVRWAVFGKQVEDFLQSDIGNYLVQCAKEKEAEAMEQLKRVYPWRRRKIQQLQNEIAIAENFQAWLGDAIVTGHASLEQLKEEHS
jgi:hypothetical protein